MSISPVCPPGYFPVTGDTSNCSTSTSSTVVKKLCPSGTTLKSNGLCGSGNTFPEISGTYCGSQYSGKDCKYYQQPTPGITVTTGTESTNMICAFLEGDAQFPCDPGCCKDQETSVEAPASSTETTTETDTTEPFPWWAVVLLIILGTLFFIFVIVLLRRKKMSLNK